MIKISQVLEEIIKKDETVLEAIRLGILNISAYAKSIHNLVEEKTKKEVKLGTIIVAISRLSKKIKKYPPLKLDVFVNDAIIKAPLAVISYEKNNQNLSQLSNFEKFSINENDFFTATLGIEEITIVCTKKIAKKVKEEFKSKPKSLLNDLIGITIKFPEEYLEVPNVIYSYLSKLAVRRINLIEVISTYSEITFIMNKKYLKSANAVLEEFLNKKD